MPNISEKRSEPQGKYDCTEWISRPQGKSCIQAPVVLSQIQMRKHITRNIALMPAPDNDHPSFTLKGTEDFKITNLRVLNKIPLRAHSDEKSVDLLVVIRYNLLYSDGCEELLQPDEACFELSIDNISCPCSNVKLFQKNTAGDYSSADLRRKTYFTANASAETFGEVICSYTGALIIDLGVFFIIRSECIMDLLVADFPSTHNISAVKETQIPINGGKDDLSLVLDKEVE
jgi:hypothetical protein